MEGQHHPYLESEADSKFDFLLRRPSAIKEAQFEESILSISAAMSPVDLRAAVCSGLHSTLENTYKAEMLMFGGESENLSYHSEDGLKPLEKEGMVWKVVRQRQMEFFSDISKDDPLWEILGIENKSMDGRVGIIMPIVNRNERRAVGVVIALSDQPNASQNMKLEWILKNTLIAVIRITKYSSLQQQKTRAEKMLKVCGSLMDFEISFLSIKLNNHMKSLVHCKCSLLLIVDEASMELVGHVFDDKPLNKVIRIPIEDGIYGSCFTSGKVIVVNDASEDPRINPAVDFINDYVFKTMMCVPIIGRKNSTSEETSVIGVAVCYNKQIQSSFTSEDQDNVVYTLKFCASMICNTLAYQRELTLKKQNQALLSIAKNLFTRLNDPDVLLHSIMEEARELIKSERCSLFLVDKENQELVATVFDSEIPGKTNTSDKLRIPIGQGIAGYVAKSGQTVNIRDAYKHPMFYKEVDKTTGFKTRNILCIPIQNNEGIVGVAQLVNKRNGRYFTMVDEELAKSFSVYCGISIYHSLLFKNVVTEQSRSRLATELMVYHMQVQTKDVDQLVDTEIVPTSHFHKRFSELTFSPRSIPLDDTPLVVMSMMQEMDFIRKWKIPKQKLARFVLMVKQGYRDMPYHNWWHAISVAHFSFLLYENCDHLSLLSDLEKLAFFISCLCHDIDHRGTNNAFQISSNSILASLYSSEGSVMERHHLAQTFCILNSRGCNILENLSPEEYSKVLDLIQDDILATDLAAHLRILKDLERMVEEGFSSSNPRHSHLINSLLMTACDLSACTKDWESSYKISGLIYREFFSQGDLEKALGVTPITMMDREKAYVPEQQFSFIQSIAEPVYRVLAGIINPTKPVYENLLQNKIKWEELRRKGQEATPT